MKTFACTLYMCTSQIVLNILYVCIVYSQETMFLDRPMLRLAGLSSSVGVEWCAQKMSVQRNDSKLSRVRKYLILLEYIYMQDKVQFSVSEGSYTINNM